jgi:hypothetical protein
MAEAALDPSHSERVGFLRAMWHKYGLIVVGNVVFFALLYFLQYRPNSRDARATEFLTLAQQQENEHHLEAAEVLYSKITTHYADCAVAAIAAERLPKVRALAKQKREMQPILPEACTAKIDLHAMLESKPSFYLAELVAGYYPEVKQAERERYYDLLDSYMWIALHRDGVPLAKLRASPAFRVEEIRQRYFALRASTRFEPDWLYDDFKIKNQNYFGWHNAVVELTVTQGEESETESVRIGELPPEAEYDVLDFRVRKDGGAVEVRGTVTADEGKVSFQQRL